MISLILYNGLRKQVLASHLINNLRALLDLKFSLGRDRITFVSERIPFPRLKVAELRPQPDHLSVQHMLPESLC